MLDVPAPLAALGAKLEVHTLEGMEDVHVRPGTQPGETIELRGRGMPILRRPGRRGDLRIVVNVVVPRRLTDKQRKLYEQLSESMTDSNLGSDESVFAKLKRTLRVLRRVIRLAIRVARADAEIALAELLELAPAGVEEVDRGDTIEYAVYGAPGELPALPALRAAAGAALVDITTTEVADDWAYALAHVPRAGDDRRAAARAPAVARRRPRDAAGLLDIAIDPAQAFGTGAHHTTRLCLELLLELEPGGAARRPRLRLGRARDRGVQARLGPGPRRRPRAGVGAGDARQRRGNGVERAGVPRGPAARGRAASAPTVVANLMRPLLLHVAAAGFACEAPRVLVLGGLLAHEADEVARRVRAPRPARARAPPRRRVGGADSFHATDIGGAASLDRIAWNVVIAGGGFGGFYAARTLARLLPPHSARIRLVNDVNFMLYTPLLPGAAAGTLEPRHVVVPLREQLDSDRRPAPRAHRRRDARAQRAAGREPRGHRRGPRTTTTSSSPSARSAARCRCPASPSTRWASSRCPRRSRCATTSCARSSTPRRSRTAPRAAST